MLLHDALRSEKFPDERTPGRLFRLQFQNAACNFGRSPGFRARNENGRVRAIPCNIRASGSLPTSRDVRTKLRKYAYARAYRMAICQTFRLGARMFTPQMFANLRHLRSYFWIILYFITASVHPITKGNVKFNLKPANDCFVGASTFAKECYDIDV